MYMSDVFFFFNDPAPTEIYTLSLHDALPIFRWSVIASWTGRTVHPLMQFHRIADLDRKSTRLNSSHVAISYAVFCLKKKKNHCGDPSGPRTDPLEISGS